MRVSRAYKSASACPDHAQACSRMKATHGRWLLIDQGFGVEYLDSSIRPSSLKWRVNNYFIAFPYTPEQLRKGEGNRGSPNILSLEMPMEVDF